MHLFVSFMLRAVSIFVKDRVVHSSAGLQDFDAALLDNVKTVSMSPLDKSQYVSTSIPGTRGANRVCFLVSLQTPSVFKREGVFPTPGKKKNSVKQTKQNQIKKYQNLEDRK